MAFNSEIKGYMTFGKSFSRGAAFPLEAYEIWTDWDALVAYAANTDPNKDPSYIGQKVAYVDTANNRVVHYGIEIDGSLKELGASPVGDESTIVVDEETKTISLKGIESLVFERDIIGEDGQPTGEKEEVKFQPLMTKDGLTWVEPSKTTVEGLATLISELTVRVSALENDRVTEQELADAIDGAKEELLGTDADTMDKNTIYGAKAAAQSAKEDVNALRGELSDDESKVTVYGAIAKANSAHEGILRLHGLDNDTSETSSIKGAKLYTEEKVAALNIGDYAKTADVNSALADKADKTALESLQDTVDAFLTGDGTEAALDSLKELIAYIDSHDDVDIAGILEDIQAIENKLELGTYVDGEETKEYATVKAYVEAAIAALKIGDYAKAADLSELADRVAALEAKPFDTYATKAELEAHAETAAETYATKDELSAHEEAAAETYATKEELEAHAEAAEEAYAKKATTLAGYGITDAYTKTEIDNKIGVPGTPAVKDSEGNVTTEAVPGTGVFASTYSKAELNALLDEIEGGSTESAASVARQLEAYQTSNNERVKKIEDKVGEDINGDTPATGLFLEVDEARKVADEAKSASSKNTGDIAALVEQLANTNTNVSNNTTEIGKINTEITTGLKPRLEALEGADEVIEAAVATNTGDIKTINETKLPALSGAIDAEAKARDDADKAIKALIGDVESGKTVVDMINAVAGTIDFSPYAKTEDVAKTYATIASVEAIYKAGEGEAAATGLLADEIDRAKKAEKKIADDLALLIENPTEALDSVKELIDHVTTHGTDIAGVITRLDGHDGILAGFGGEGQPATVKAYVDGAIAAIPEYVLPQATAEVLGGVKSAKDVVNGETTSVAVNKVYVGEDGVGEVKAFSTDNLVQGSMTLVLNGGNAEVSAS